MDEVQDPSYLQDALAVKMFGDLFAEAAALILVFGFLEPMINEGAGKSVAMRLDVLDFWWGVFVVFLTYLSFHMAYWLRRRLPPKTLEEVTK